MLSCCSTATTVHYYYYFFLLLSLILWCLLGAILEGKLRQEVPGHGSAGCLFKLWRGIGEHLMSITSHISDWENELQWWHCATIVFLLIVRTLVLCMVRKTFIPRNILLQKLLVYVCTFVCISTCMFTLFRWWYFQIVDKLAWMLCCWWPTSIPILEHTFLYTCYKLWVDAVCIVVMVNIYSVL